MGILERKLNEYLGREIIIVQLDGKVLRGKLADIDEEALMMINVMELIPPGKWRLPSIELSEGKTQALNEVLIPLSAVSRIWPITAEKPLVPLIKPEVVKRVPEEKYVIRSVSTQEK